MIGRHFHLIWLCFYLFRPAIVLLSRFLISYWHNIESCISGSQYSVSALRTCKQSCQRSATPRYSRYKSLIFKELIKEHRRCHCVHWRSVISSLCSVYVCVRKWYRMRTFGQRQFVCSFRRINSIRILHESAQFEPTNMEERRKTANRTRLNYTGRLDSMSLGNLFANMHNLSIKLLVQPPETR